MNGVTNLEHRASSSQSKHEGEPSFALCDRLDRTRANSQRQLPTDHDYAVPTREYQTDQSSLIPAQAAARSVFEKRKQKHQHNPTYLAPLTGSLHIRAMRSSRFVTGLLRVPTSSGAACIRSRGPVRSDREQMRDNVPLLATD